MTVGTNRIITFGDLVAWSKDMIKGLCKNIDAFANDVPAQYRNGSVVTRASKSFSRTNGNNNVTWRTAYTSILRSTTGDGSLVVVPSATVNSDLESFFSSRGLNTKTNTVMSTKAIINFFNNMASFMSVKLWHIYCPHEGNTSIIFYNPNAVTYPAVENLYGPTYLPLPAGKTLSYFKPVEPFNTENPQYEEIALDSMVDVPSDHDAVTNDAELESSLRNFISSVGSLNNAHQALVTMSYSSCSCSSSSSSSSSSCSSSSSSFIAYMDI